MTIFETTQTTLTDSNGNPLRNLDGSVMTSPSIGKSEQLLLHAGLGAITSSLTGNDAVSGAIAGVAGELTAELANKGGVDVPTSIQLANLAGAISSITYGGLTNQSDEQMANNAWEGSRIGGNAAKENALYAQAHKVVVKKDLSGPLGVKKLMADLNVWAEFLGGRGDLEAPILEAKYESNSHHLSWRIEPENQEKWINDPKFGKYFTNINPENGKYYATIGGGPDNGIEDILKKDFPNLYGNINREPYDVNLINKNLVIQISPSAIGNEDLKIQQLFDLNRNFGANPNKLNYWLFPGDKSNFYNSNSYFTGIGQAAGLPIPQFNIQAPGYNKPVPPSYFINQN
jgi:hypothetical protein